MKKTNRLINEKSPYLLQHAFNPVDWFPWGFEAFEKAHTENKPIFLSIGYSTCYWCHVMEREVFENESLAALMNDYFVSVKVDREERPDVDRVYMAALQAMTGSGGWPMSMFLTPGLKPFFGATYIPPVSTGGRSGFGEIMQRIHDVWTNDRAQVDQVSQRLGDLLTHIAHPDTTALEADIRTLDHAFEAFANNYDKTHAGFGGAPKFPRPVVYNLLLRYYARSGRRQALEMTVETLRRIAASGMHDHIGGGFHRYATDERWHVPHFEKMLYDQAQLAISYLEVYQLTREEFFAEVARDVLDYVLRVMTHPDGGFYSAEDAESLPGVDSSPQVENTPLKKEEGAFYVWTKDEIDRILTPDEVRIFNDRFGMGENGNVLADPHGVFRGKNILHIAERRPDSSTDESNAIFTRAKQKVFEARERRTKPHLDDKVLVSWNALMILAFSRAYQVLGEKRYLEAAMRATRFVLDKLADCGSGQLLRRYRDGESRFEAHLEDYALLVQALLDLYEASFDIEWLKAASTFAKRQNELFFDRKDGGFFDVSGNDPTILVRTKEWYDGAEPTGNSIAILNLLRLSQMINGVEYEAMARKSLAYFGQRLHESPQATPQFLVALDFSLSKPKQIIIAGAAEDPGTAALLREVHSRFIPNKVLLLADGAGGQEFLSASIPFLATIQMSDGKPTAYVCENYACRLPTSDPDQLSELLKLTAV